MVAGCGADKDEGIPKLSTECKWVDKKFETVKMRQGYFHPVKFENSSAQFLFPIKNQTIDMIYTKSYKEHFAEQNGKVIFYGRAYFDGIVQVKHLLPDRALESDIKAFQMKNRSFSVSYVWKLDNGYLVINAIPAFDGTRTLAWYNAHVQSFCEVKDINMLSFIE